MSTAARLEEARAAFGGVFRNPGLRRIQLALAGSETGWWAAGVALAVIAYRAGGPTAVGLVVLLQRVPSAAAAPFTALLGDRLPRRRVMLGADISQAGLVGAAAAVELMDGPVGAIYALAALAAVASTAFRPAQAAILPTLARTPDELTAANVASSTIESVTSFVGPALAGVVVASADPGLALAITAGLLVWSALMVAGIPDTGTPEASPEAGSAGGDTIVRQLAAGGETIARDGRLRLLVGFFAAQVLVWGLLYVLIVSLALDELDAGEEGYGVLLAALGVGGVIGAIAAAGLVGRRLSTAFGVAMIFWGLPIALIPVWPEYAVVLVLLGVVGLANTVGDVAGMTLLQRAVPDPVLARAFGVLELVFLAMSGAGSALAPALVAGLGLDGALVATGLILPVLTVLAWRRIVAIDTAAEIPVERLALLRGISFFRPLPVPALEHLAGALAPVAAPAGRPVFREGDPGDRFYVVESGEVEVTQGGRRLRRLGRGEFFGEIALLRDVPRTATVTAVGDVSLLALDGAEFLGAVTGHSTSAEAADAVLMSYGGVGRRAPGAGY
jgi:MFS family permease